MDNLKMGDDLIGLLFRLTVEREVTIRKKGGVDVIRTAMKQHASVAAVQEHGRRSLELLDAK